MVIMTTMMMLMIMMTMMTKGFSCSTQKEAPTNTRAGSAKNRLYTGKVEVLEGQ